MSDEYQFVPGQYNSIPPEVVILGGPGDLFGVQSVDADGELSTFSNSANYMELGEDLCGIHTIDRTNGTLWSGSSFATAIAAARIATGDALTASPPPPSTGSTTTPSTSSGPSATTPPPDIPESMETTLGDCRSSAVLEQPAASTTVGA
jgi:hypothetical protein